MGKNRVVIYHQKSIFADLSTDPSIWPFFTFIEGYKVETTDLQKGYTVFQISSRNQYLRVSLWWGLKGREGLHLPASEWGACEGNQGRGEESLLPASGEAHRWRVFLSLSLRTTEKTADFPVSKPHHRHLQLLHSALRAHEGKKRQSPQTILPCVCVCVCVCVSPSDHRIEEAN